MQKEKSSEEQEYKDEEEEELEEEEYPVKKKRTGEKEKEFPTSKVEENVESINIEKEAPTQKELVVPVLEFEEAPKIEIERSLHKEIPKIEKEERKISVPVVDLKLPSFTLRRYTLNSEIQEIKKEKRQLIIPKIQLRSMPSLSLRITELDAKIEKPQVSLKLPKVPFYQTEKYELKSFLTSFDTTVNEELKLLLLEEHEEDGVGSESAEKETVEQMVTTVAAEPEAPSGGDEEEEDIPDFLDLIFGGEAGRITGEGVKVILLKNRGDDECTEFLKEVCERIYREQEGGEPTFESIEKIEDLPDQPSSYSRPDQKLFHVDLDKIEKEETTKENLYNRLQRLLKKVPSAKSGFILLTTRDKSIYDAFSSTLEQVNSDLKGQLKRKIIELEFRKLSPRPKRSIASLCWGMVDLTPIPVTFDYAFIHARNVFEKKLKKTREDFQLIPKTSEGEESKLHFGIKTFLVKILAHEKGLLPNKPSGLKEEDANKIKEEISTEKKLDVDIIPDIWVKKDSIAYEVETLFGIGVKESKTPQKRFQEDVIDKYKPETQAKNLNIVMDNFGFLMHLKDIKKTRDFYEKHLPKVEFYTLDLQNDKIIPFGDVVKSLKKIKEENEFTI